MNLQHPRENPAQDAPLFWEPSIAFLRLVTQFIVFGSLFYGAVLLILAPDQTWRVLVVTLMLLIGMTSWYLLSRGKTRATVLTLTCSVWIYCTVTAPFTGGLNGTSIIIYPIVVLLLGWLSGVRAALIATLMTATATLAFALMESLGYLPVPAVTPPLMRWIIQCGIFVLTAALISHATVAYRNRLNELRALSRDFARAQAVAHVGRWVYDIGADHMQLSAETCRIFGMPEHTSGSHDAYLARVHEDDRATVEAAWQAALQGGPAFDSEHRIRVGNATRWVRQMAELAFDAQGKAVRSVGTTHDITERHAADDALRLARIGIETAAEPLFWITPEARIIDANRAACRSLGYTREELLSLSVQDIDVQYDHQAWPGHIADLRRLGSMTFESTHRAKDGRLFAVEIVCCTVKEQTTFSSSAGLSGCTRATELE